MLTPATKDGNTQGAPTTAPKKCCYTVNLRFIYLQQWRNAWRGLPHADIGRILQWSWRQYSWSEGPSRLSRIHGRLEVTRCITDGAPDFVSQVMIIDCGYRWFQEERIFRTMVLYFVKSWFRVHLTAFYSPADNPNALIVLPFQVHHAPPWVSLNIKECLRFGCLSPKFVLAHRHDHRLEPCPHDYLPTVLIRNIVLHLHCM